MIEMQKGTKLFNTLLIGVLNLRSTTLMPPPLSVARTAYLSPPQPTSSSRVTRHSAPVNPKAAVAPDPAPAAHPQVPVHMQPRTHSRTHARPHAHKHSRTRTDAPSHATIAHSQARRSHTRKHGNPRKKH